MSRDGPVFRGSLPGTVSRNEGTGCSERVAAGVADLRPFSSGGGWVARTV